jgi:hypothetical protein
MRGRRAAERSSDGVLPAAVNGPVAVAATLRLDREVDRLGLDAVEPNFGN